MKRQLLAMAALLWALPGARADEAPLFTVDAGGSTLTYHLVHKLHRFDGISHKVEGRARMLPGGQVQVMVRAPVESFDSGNSNRDEHMKETVDAARFPTVELKAAGDGVSLPASLPAAVDKMFTAQVTFHGVQKAMAVPVRLSFDNGGRVRADASFSLSLEAFNIERPSLMFVKVDDEMKVEAHLVFAR